MSFWRVYQRCVFHPAAPCSAENEIQDILERRGARGRPERCCWLEESPWRLIFSSGFFFDGDGQQHRGVIQTFPHLNCFIHTSASSGAWKVLNRHPSASHWENPKEVCVYVCVCDSEDFMKWRERMMDEGPQKVPGVQQVRTKGDGMMCDDGRQMTKQWGERMERSWARYHDDGFLEHLSFSASGFTDSTENAWSKTTLPTTPLHFCCHVTDLERKTTTEPWFRPFGGKTDIEEFLCSRKHVTLVFSNKLMDKHGN